MKKVKVLVTGATGFVGSHVADKLITKGYEVNCTIRNGSNLKWLKNKNLTTTIAPLDDRQALINAVKDCHYVYHVAGSTFGRNFDEFIKSNRDGTINLLDTIEENAKDIKRLIFVSSQTVSGPAKSLNNPVNENTPMNPLTSYGKSKKLAEDEIIKRKGIIPYTILRAPAVFGPRDTAIFDYFKIVNKGIGPLIGLKKKYLNLIYSDDLARGLIEAAESENTINKIYFIASKEIYNWDQIIESIQKALNKQKVFKLRVPHFIVLSAAFLSEWLGKFSSKPPVFNYEKGIDFIQDYWICSSKKAEQDFGFSEQFPLDESIRLTVNWYKKMKWL